MYKSNSWKTGKQEACSAERVAMEIEMSRGKVLEGCTFDIDSLEMCRLCLCRAEGYQKLISCMLIIQS